jgi:hypothetical protein
VNRRWTAVGAVVVGIACCACGAGQGVESVVSTFGTPSISSISPESYTTTTSLQTMTISGSGFPRDATLSFLPPTGTPIQSTASRLIYVSTTQLSYKFNSGGDAGSWNVVVVTPDGHRSNPQLFAVK